MAEGEKCQRRRTVIEMNSIRFLERGRVRKPSVILRGLGLGGWEVGGQKGERKLLLCMIVGLTVYN